jgi:hypothetical protein
MGKPTDCPGLPARIPAVVVRNAGLDSLFVVAAPVSGPHFSRTLPPGRGAFDLESA